MKRVNQFLPREHIEGLAKMSAKTGLPIAEHTRIALEQYLRRHKVLKAKAER